MLLIYQ